MDLEHVFAKVQAEANKLANQKNQTVFMKGDLFITLEQLENILLRIRVQNSANQHATA